MLLLVSLLFVVAADQGEELRWAVRFNDLKKLEHLVRGGADVNAKGGFCGRDAVECGCEARPLEGVRVLSEPGC